MSSRARVSMATIYDCDKVKIVKSDDGQSVDIQFGPNDVINNLRVLVYRWREGPIEIEVTDEATEAKAKADREAAEKVDEI